MSSELYFKQKILSNKNIKICYFNASALHSNPTKQVGTYINRKGCIILRLAQLNKQNYQKEHFIFRKTTRVQCCLYHFWTAWQVSYGTRHMASIYNPYDLLMYCQLYILQFDPSIDIMPVSLPQYCKLQLTMCPSHRNAHRWQFNF